MEAVEFKVLSQDEESKTNEEIKPVEIVEESQSFLWRFRSSNYFICTVVSVALFGDGLFYAIIIPIIPEYVAVLNLSQTAIGFLFAMFPAAILITSLAYANVADRFARKPVMVLSLFATAVSTILFAFSANYWILLLARALQGVCSAITWITGLSLIADAYPVAQQGKVNGYLMIANGVGMIGGPVFGGTLYDWSGQRKEVPFLVAALLILLDAPLRLLIREPKKRISGEGKNGLAVLSKDVPIMMAFGFNMFGSAIVTALEPVLPTYFQAKFNMDPIMIGVFIGINGLVFSLASPVFGALVDKFPKRKEEIMVMGVTISCVCYPLFPLPTPEVGTKWVILALLVITGISSAAEYSPLMPLVNEKIENTYGGKYYGAGASMMNFTYSLGSIIGPIALSGMCDTFGLVAGFVSFAAVVATYTIVYVFVILVKHKYLGTSNTVTRSPEPLEMPTTNFTDTNDTNDSTARLLHDH